MKHRFRVIAALLATFYAGLASAATLPNRNFWVGYNEPWFGDNNYGEWLSANPVFGIPSHFGDTLGVLDAYFDSMRRGNAKVVRIWLFPALQGVSLAPSTPPNPQTQGLTSDFVANLETVLAKARLYGLRVYVTALNGGDMKSVFGVNPSLQTYFKNLLTNGDGERAAFKTKVLVPVIRSLKRYRDVIYAFDLMNEIEAPISVGYVSVPEAQDWIRDMAAFVKARTSIPVTSSAGYGYAVQEITMGLYSGLGLDFYDTHVYADMGQYSGQPALCKKVRADGLQIILGEYGQTSKISNNALQDMTTARFLLRAKSSCFSAALAWKFETTNQKWFTYLLTATPNLTFRPAYFTIKQFGALP